MVNGIITSTPGSCPIQNEKIHSIGQALDSEVFSFSPKLKNEFNEGLQIGRFDESKKIMQIADTCNAIRVINLNIKFTQIGSSSNSKAVAYLDLFKKRYNAELESKKFILLPSMLRNELPDLLRKFDFFIHAYQRTLD